MKKEKCFVSFSYYDPYAMIKREEIFCHLATMFTNEDEKTFFFLSINHDYYNMIKTEKSFFQLVTMFTNEEGKMFFFWLFTMITTP